MTDNRVLRSKGLVEESPPGSVRNYALRRETTKPLRYREQTHGARALTNSPSPKKSPARLEKPRVPVGNSPSKLARRIKTNSPLKSPTKKRIATLTNRDSDDRGFDEHTDSSFIDPGSAADTSPTSFTSSVPQRRPTNQQRLSQNSLQNGANSGHSQLAIEAQYDRVAAATPPPPPVTNHAHFLAQQSASSAANRTPTPTAGAAPTPPPQTAVMPAVPKASDLPPTLKENLRRLKNVLKLPKARRWVYYEFFYSNADRQLFLGDNEFSQCLRESFPNLKCRDLSKVEWRQVRRLIGKPRRCSQSFFDEERMALAQKRQKIRDIYMGIWTEMSVDLSDIPVQIPRPLVVGAKIYARVQHPKDGIYAGTVDAVLDDSYRIIFDKEELIPPLIIKDYEVMSTNVSRLDLVSVTYFLEKNRASMPFKAAVAARPAYMSPSKILSSDRSPLLLRHDPVLTGASIGTGSHAPQHQAPSASARAGAAAVTGTLLPRRGVNASLFGKDEKVGNFPVRMLVMLVKLSKLIEIKRTRVKQIAEMNVSLERLSMITDRHPYDLQERYAQIMLELEQVNGQLCEYVSGVSEYASAVLLPQLTTVAEAVSRPDALRHLCHTHAVQIVKHSNNGLGVESRRATDLATALTALLLQLTTVAEAVSRPDALRHLCHTHAVQIVKHSNNGLGVESRRATDLATALTTLLLQVRQLGQRQRASFELGTLTESLKQLRMQLVSPQNAAAFQDHVEVHMKHIHHMMLQASSSAGAANAI